MLIYDHMGVPKSRKSLKYSHYSFRRESKNKNIFFKKPINIIYNFYKRKYIYIYFLYIRQNNKHLFF